MIYVAEVKTTAGNYFRFYEVVESTTRTQTVQLIGIKPYKKLSNTEFEVEPDASKPYGPTYKVHKDTHGIYIEGSGKKGIQKTYLTAEHGDGTHYVNHFDAGKLK